MSETQPAASLDTSFVVRHLTNDPPEMAAIAAKIIDSDQPLTLSEVILAEIACVLSSVYEIPRPAVVDTLMSFIQRRNIRLLTLPKPSALEALRLCRDSKRYSFADVLLWAEALHTGISRVYTFDKRFPSTGLERLGVK